MYFPEREKPPFSLLCLCFTKLCFLNPKVRVFITVDVTPFLCVYGGDIKLNIPREGRAPFYLHIYVGSSERRPPFYL